MSDFPFKVGDRVRRAEWRNPERAVTITAVGRSAFLALKDGAAQDDLFAQSGGAMYGGPWMLAPEPKPEKPEWLDDAWINVYPGGVALLASHASASRADAYAESYRIGRVCVGTGEWVPCRGQEVAA